MTDYHGLNVTLRDYRDVIRHYTENSLAADQFDGFEVRVSEQNGVYNVRVSTADSAPDSSVRVRQFAKRHVLLFSPAEVTRRSKG